MVSINLSVVFHDILFNSFGPRAPQIRYYPLQLWTVISQHQLSLAIYQIFGLVWTFVEFSPRVRDVLVLLKVPDDAELTKCYRGKEKELIW